MTCRRVWAKGGAGWCMRGRKRGDCPLTFATHAARIGRAVGRDWSWEGAGPLDQTSPETRTSPVRIVASSESWGPLRRGPMPCMSGPVSAPSPPLPPSLVRAPRRPRLRRERAPRHLPSLYESAAGSRGARMRLHGAALSSRHWPGCREEDSGAPPIRVSHASSESPVGVGSCAGRVQSDLAHNALIICWPTHLEPCVV